MTYAMILQNRVIGVLENQEEKPWWPPDPEGNPVTAVPCDSSVILGMIYDPETGEFSEYIPPEPEPEPEPQPSQLDQIQADQLVIKEALAEQYEISTERNLSNMEALATIYETLLEVQEGSI